MDFMLFQIVFAIILIALAATGWLLWRSIRKRREERGHQPPRSASAPRVAGLGRKREDKIMPEPEAPRVRKRQIGPASAAETVPEHIPEAPLDDPVAEAPVPAPTPTPTPLDTVADELAPVPSIQGETMARLETAFIALQAAEMTLADYIALTEEQERILAERIAALQDSGPADALDDARAARDAVLWCRQWARDMDDGDPRADDI